MKAIKEQNNINNKIGKQSIRWIFVLFYVYLHVLGIIGMYFLFTRAKWMTVFYFLFLVTISLIGLTTGAHRLYAHRTFAAIWQVRLFIMLAHTLAGVGPIHESVFWHRMHHRYYCTERDPYNHKKGFLYSHCISNLLSAPSDIKAYARDIDMRDIEEDGYVWTQRKFYWILFIVFGLLLPTNVPIEYWNESIINSILIIGAGRLMITTHIAWLVNSALLIWGLEKGAKFPVDDNSVFFVSKSYWLNYHYLVAWDFKNDEFGNYNAGFATFIVKMLRELGCINEMTTTTSKDVRDALCKMATSETTLKRAMTEMQKNAEAVAYKQKLMYHH
ncbi:acyl-CoA Delta-9 desaturase [Polyergus mexicanus]|uniref:acyl-CoA Delta-9 desaturase n=1 Tax=Polyergus mexicanus TaxID=615972 RepID=UPI0038B4DC1A